MVCEDLSKETLGVLELLHRVPLVCVHLPGGIGVRIPAVAVWPESAGDSWSDCDSVPSSWDYCKPKIEAMMEKPTEKLTNREPVPMSAQYLTMSVP